MPAILSRNRIAAPPADAGPSEAVASVLANLQQCFGGDQPRLSHREFRMLARERAHNAERQVWQPIRHVARDRGVW